jgi:hypothetical protein
MLKKIRALGVTFMAFAAACEMPTEPDVEPGVSMQVVQWVPNAGYSAPLGHEFDIEETLGVDVETASSASAGTTLGVGPVLGTDRWRGVCLGPGYDKIRLYFHDGARDSVAVECKGVGTITGFLSQITNVNQYVGQPTGTVSIVGNAQVLWRRIVDGQTEVSCSQVGTYEYIYVTAPDHSTRWWYKYECVHEQGGGG